MGTYLCPRDAGYKVGIDAYASAAPRKGPVKDWRGDQSCGRGSPLVIKPTAWIGGERACGGV